MSQDEYIVGADEILDDGDMEVLVAGDDGEYDDEYEDVVVAGDDGEYDDEYEDVAVAGDDDEFEEYIDEVGRRRRRRRRRRPRYRRPRRRRRRAVRRAVLRRPQPRYVVPRSVARHIGRSVQEKGGHSIAVTGLVPAGQTVKLRSTEVNYNFHITEMGTSTKGGGPLGCTVTNAKLGETHVLTGESWPIEFYDTSHQRTPTVSGTLPSGTAATFEVRNNDPETDCTVYIWLAGVRS